MVKRSRRERLAEDMARLGIARDEEHCFGRPYVLGFSVPAFAIAERFVAGDSVEALHEDYSALGVEEVENAIRFAMLWPQSDLPSFWQSLRVVSVGHRTRQLQAKEARTSGERIR